MSQWLLLTALWIACGMFLVRGIGNPIQTALIIGGGMPSDPLAGPDAQATQVFTWCKLRQVAYYCNQAFPTHTLYMHTMGAARMLWP